MNETVATTYRCEFRELCADLPFEVAVLLRGVKLASIQQTHAAWSKPGILSLEDKIMRRRDVVMVFLDIC